MKSYDIFYEIRKQRNDQSEFKHCFTISVWLKDVYFVTYFNEILKGLY